MSVCLRFSLSLLKILSRWLERVDPAHDWTMSLTGEFDWRDIKSIKQSVPPTFVSHRWLVVIFLKRCTKVPDFFLLVLSISLDLIFVTKLLSLDVIGSFFK